jgi:hypothetical protein
MMLISAAALLVLIGLVHSVLGEKYILQRLFRQPLPKLFGDDEFTKRTLRFAWHITSLLFFGFAAILALLHFEAGSARNLLRVTAICFAATALTALIASRGRHLSWPVFTAIAALCWLAAAVD